MPRVCISRQKHEHINYNRIEDAQPSIPKPKFPIRDKFKGGIASLQEVLLYQCVP